MGRVLRDRGGPKEGGVEMRKSPRTGVRKMKKSSLGLEEQNQFEMKSSRKRKAVRYEDDPSYSEEEEVENEMEQQKKVPGYRCSSLFVAELMEKLSQKQKAWVHKIGFSALENLVGSRPPKSLTMWLVDRVDTVNGTIQVCGEHIDIRGSVKRMLNLPCGDMKVPQPLHGRSKAKIPKIGSSRHNEKHSDHGRGQTAKDAMKLVIAETDDEVSFCQSFVLLVLCIYLAPTTSLNINRSYYPAVIDTTQISLMDWCGFIADYLIRGIDEYRNSKASHVQVPGCVHLLPLIYIDALIRHKALVLPPAIALPDGEPMIHFVRSEHLDFLASADVSSKSKDHIEYGLLQDNFLRSRKGASKHSYAHKNNNSGVSDPVDVHMETMGLNTDEVDNFLRSRKGASKHSYAHKNDNSGVSDPVDVHMETMGLNTDEVRTADEMVESMFKDIVEGRKKLFMEFQEKVVDSDRSIFCRFKESIISFCDSSVKKKHQSCNSARGRGGINVPVGDNSEKVDKTIADDLVCETIVHLKDNPIEETVIKKVVVPEANKETADEKDSAIDAEEALVVENEGMCSEIHSDGSGESLSNCRIETENLFVDELQQVVKIGQEAASEACQNVCGTGQTENDVTMLGILSEAASIGGATLYDSTPAVVANKLHRQNIADGTSDMVQDDIISSSSNRQMTGCYSLVRKPVYDESPGTPFDLSILGNKRKGDMMTSGEVNIGCMSEQKDVFAGSLLHAGPMQQKAVEQWNLPPIESATQTEKNSDSEVCEKMEDALAASSESSDTNTDDESNFSEIPDALGDDGLVNGDYKDPLEMTPGFVLTPCYTNMTPRIIDVDSLKLSCGPADTCHVRPLEKEIESGCRFTLGGSVSTYTVKLFDRLKKISKGEDSKEILARYKYVLCKDSEATYKKHVKNSTARISARFANVIQADRHKTKIQIKGFHVTRGEFVDALKPNGEVSQSLMGLCSVAIMNDWGTKKRAILDQATIRELMKDKEVFDPMTIAARLKRTLTEDVEEIFLPMLTGHHWILGVVDLFNCKVELHDSLIMPAAGENPHRNLWAKVSWNLEHAYGIVMMKTVDIFDFPCEYQEVKLQTNTHDCGFHVIQSLECYGSEDLVGHGKLKTLVPYRRYLSHVLIYHQFNDLNPMREGPHDEAL